jgi:hypothetical protein
MARPFRGNPAASMEENSRDRAEAPARRSRTAVRSIACSGSVVLNPDLLWNAGLVKRSTRV